MSKDKKSILEEAANELMSIVETAKKQAKDNLAKELPEKFDVLLKEELNKLSPKESVKESVKDKYKKEPIVEGKKTDKKKESINEMDMTEFSMDEVENAFDQADSEDDFSVVSDEEGVEGEVSVDDIASAIDAIDDMNNEKVEEEEKVVTDPFTKLKEFAEQMGQMVKEMEQQKMHEEYGVQFESDMANLYGEGYAEQLGEETCAKLKETYIAKKMGEPFGDNSHAAPNVNESKVKPFEEKGKSLEEGEDQPFEDKANPSKEQGKSIDEMHEKVPRGATADPDKGHNTTPAGINEEEEEDDKVEVEIEVGGEDEKEEDREEKEMDETAGSAKGHAANRTVGNENMPHSSPRKDSTQRQFQKETYEKRMKSLIEENKKLTKEVNEAKKGFEKAEQLVENYKNHLEKYRNQLREMAVFNTNLANVNNLLVNESLALTTNDKVSIINKFKSIDNIDESDKAYGEILTEMKKGKKKKTISEDVEEKVSKSVGESSTPKEKINEAIEKTAYEKNAHVEKLKKLINYVETRR
jgi:hypothetical protein